MRKAKFWTSQTTKSSTNNNKRRQGFKNLKKARNSYYKLTPIGLLFSSSAQNDTKQIFVTCRELNDAKVAHINGKISNILGIINLNKIENSRYFKGKSL